MRAFAHPTALRFKASAQLGKEELERIEVRVVELGRVTMMGFAINALTRVYWVYPSYETHQFAIYGLHTSISSMLSGSPARRISSRLNLDKPARRAQVCLTSSAAPIVRTPTSQTRAILSSDAMTRRFPSGLNAAELSSSFGPRSAASSRPVSASHRRAVPSLDAVTTRL